MKKIISNYLFGIKNPNLPSYLTFYVNNICQLRCDMCFYWDSMQKKTIQLTTEQIEKLAKSFFTALKKRPIDQDTIEKVVSRVTRELEELGQAEIQSNVIGKKVMDTLKELDKIAYIRYASVYTNFKEVGEFGEYIEELDGKSNK